MFVIAQESGPDAWCHCSARELEIRGLVLILPSRRNNNIMHCNLHWRGNHVFLFINRIRFLKWYYCRSTRELSNKKDILQLIGTSLDTYFVFYLNQLIPQTEMFWLGLLGFLAHCNNYMTSPSQYPDFPNFGIIFGKLSNLDFVMHIGCLWERGWRDHFERGPGLGTWQGPVRTGRLRVWTEQPMLWLCLMQNWQNTNTFWMSHRDIWGEI